MFLLLSILALLVARESPLETSPLNAIDKGWQSFEYGERDTEVYGAFSAVSTATPIVLRITDLSHPGSAFRVLSNGRRVLITPVPATDYAKGPTCNPLRSYNSAAWSHGHTVLRAGFHHVRVFMRYSPWNAGVGAILFEKAVKCPYESNGLFLVDSVLDWDNAAKVCEAYGGHLADLHRPSSWSPSKHARLLSSAFRVVKRCKPENDSAWIKGCKNQAFLEEGEFPASVKAYSEVEGLTGAEWEVTQMATLCQVKRRTHSDI